MSNAFAIASGVEKKGMEVLLPYIRERSLNGQLVTTEKGRLSMELQARYGDVLFNAKNGEVVAVEVKIEQRNKYGNLFLETWSNRNYQMSKRGWLDTLNADYIWYYFLDDDELYIIDFPRLWNWCYVAGNIYNYPEKEQKKYDQLNTTCGRVVPIEHLLAAQQDGGKIIAAVRAPLSELLKAA